MTGQHRNRGEKRTVAFGGRDGDGLANDAAPIAPGRSIPSPRRMEAGDESAPLWPATKSGAWDRLSTMLIAGDWDEEEDDDAFDDDEDDDFFPDDDSEEDDFDDDEEADEDMDE